jgi:hypothetical protein
MVPANYVGHKTANPSGSEKPKATANIKRIAQLRIFFFWQNSSIFKPEWSQ